jgi:hypothetical protein
MCLQLFLSNFHCSHVPDAHCVPPPCPPLFPAIKWVMALFDVPEAIAVSRTAICAAGGQLAQLTRIQAAGFYLGVLAYYWLLATPTVGFLFGCYLYLSVNL